MAERPGVEKLGAHGLFSQTDDKINLAAVCEDVSQHNGTMFTHVISLRREDAERLGYEQMLNLHYVGITRAKQVCNIMQGTVRHKADGTPVQTKESQFLYLNEVERYRIDKNWN